MAREQSGIPRVDILCSSIYTGDYWKNSHRWVLYKVIAPIKAIQQCTDSTNPAFSTVPNSVMNFNTRATCSPEISSLWADSSFYLQSHLLFGMKLFDFRAVRVEVIASLLDSHKSIHTKSNPNGVAPFITALFKHFEALQHWVSLSWTSPMQSLHNNCWHSVMACEWIHTLS